MESAIIPIRHGKTNYTEKDLDLTLQGIEETKDLARDMAKEITSYDELIVLSSPLARTRGTAKVFLDELNMSTDPKIMRSVRCIDIHDIRAFHEFEKTNSTSVYGQMWFNHPDLAETSNFAEGRNLVNERAGQFLRHMSQFVARRSKETGKRICVLVFTHFEIASNYLRPLYDTEIFPDVEAPGIKNSEAIKILVNPETPREVTIEARTLRKKALIDGNNLIPLD